MAKFKRSNKSDMEQLLVAGCDSTGVADQNLATGALVNSTSALGLVDGQLGVLSWDFDGTVALGNFIAAGTTVANVKAIKVVQGTPASANTFLADPWQAGDKAYVESGIIYGDQIQSVTVQKPKPGRNSTLSFVDFIAAVPVDETEYSFVGRLDSVRNQRDYGRTGGEYVSAAYTTPDYTVVTVNNELDHMFMGLLYDLNSNSKLVHRANPGYQKVGAGNYVAFAVNVGGGNGAVIGTLTCGSTITVQRDTITDNFVGSSTILDSVVTVDVEMMRGLGELISKQASNTGLTAPITGTSTIEVINPLLAGQGTAATGVMTVTGNFTANDAVTINGQAYTFVAAPAVAYDVDLGGTAAISLTNLQAAINASGTPGTEYFAGTLINPDVSATGVTATTLTVTAKIGGVVGNALTWVETLDGGGTWSLDGGGVLSGGVDANIDAFILVGLANERAVVDFDQTGNDINQMMTVIEGSLGDGFLVQTTHAKCQTLPEEAKGSGRDWLARYQERIEGTIHTLQSRPSMWHAYGNKYFSKDSYYTSYIIDYYDTESAMTTTRVQPKQLNMLYAGTWDCTALVVNDLVTNLAAGTADVPSNTTACVLKTTNSTLTVPDIVASLDAWLITAETTFGFSVKGDATAGGPYLIV